MMDVPVNQKNTIKTKNVESMTNSNGSIVEDAVAVWFAEHCVVSWRSKKQKKLINEWTSDKE